MFERFTQGARKATVDAQGAARRLGHGHIGTEHLLLGLLEQLETLQVANARSSGWSWQEIAAELGVSRQAVHKKHAARRGLLRRD